MIELLDTVNGIELRHGDGKYFLTEPGELDAIVLDDDQIAAKDTLNGLANAVENHDPDPTPKDVHDGRWIKAIDTSDRHAHFPDDDTLSITFDDCDSPDGPLTVSGTRLLEGRLYTDRSWRATTVEHIDADDVPEIEYDYRD